MPEGVGRGKGKVPVETTKGADWFRPRWYGNRSAGLSPASGLGDAWLATNRVELSHVQSRLQAGAPGAV